MSDNTKRLLTIKDKISTSQTKYDKAKGKQDGLKEQLKEFKCSTIAQAEIALENIDDKIEKNEKELEKGLKELEQLIKEIEDEDKDDAEED